MKVRNVMSETPFCCKQTDTVQHAADLMKMHDVGSVPVVNDSEERRLVGIVTDRDICLNVVGAGKSPSIKVGDVMTKSPTACHPDDSLTSCESLMQKHQVRRIPVVDDGGRCVGIVAQADVALHDSSAHTAHMVSAVSKQRAASKRSAAGHRVAMVHA